MSNMSQTEAKCGHEHVHVHWSGWCSVDVVMFLQSRPPGICVEISGSLVPLLFHVKKWAKCFCPVCWQFPKQEALIHEHEELWQGKKKSIPCLLSRVSKMSFFYMVGFRSVKNKLHANPITWQEHSMQSICWNSFSIRSAGCDIRLKPVTFKTSGFFTMAEATILAPARIPWELTDLQNKQHSPSALHPILVVICLVTELFSFPMNIFTHANAKGNTKFSLTGIRLLGRDIGMFIQIYVINTTHYNVYMVTWIICSLHKLDHDRIFMVM